MISGFATPEGTDNFAKRQSNVAKNYFKKFIGLSLSSVGIGTYLGNPDDLTDKIVNEAIKTSIRSGINVIDTAINYRAQKAERTVGRAISELVQSGELKREEIFISTKNGYVTNDGDVKEDFWINIQNTLVKPGVIQPGDISSGYHCMTISYLQDQLKRSLKNMDIDCIDLIYIHNAAEGQLQDISKEEFIKKLGDVFEFYEEQRRKGFVKYYGMATWDCFRVVPDNPQYLSIAEISEVAKKIGGANNGFKFIQLPYNMYLDQALTMKNQRIGENQYSILESATKLGIGVFASVPLMQSKLLGPNIIPEFGEMSKPSHRAIQFVRSTPGIIAPLVGQKSQEHIKENLGILSTPVLNEMEFSDLIKKLSS